MPRMETEQSPKEQVCRHVKYARTCTELAVLGALQACHMESLFVQPHPFKVFPELR